MQIAFMGGKDFAFTQIDHFAKNTLNQWLQAYHFHLL